MCCVCSHAIRFVLSRNADFVVLEKAFGPKIKAPASNKQPWICAVGNLDVKKTE
jgi:hypothetical protein